MREANCPAILVECGFISNAAELEQLKSGEYQNKLAAVLLTALLPALLLRRAERRRA